MARKKRKERNMRRKNEKKEWQCERENKEKKTTLKKKVFCQACLDPTYSLECGLVILPYQIMQSWFTCFCFSDKIPS